MMSPIERLDIQCDKIAVLRKRNQHIPVSDIVALVKVAREVINQHHWHHSYGDQKTG